MPCATRCGGGVDLRVAPEVARGRARAGRARPAPGVGGQDCRPARESGDGLRAPLRHRPNVTEVVVTAPARLHFGMLDPAGVGSRRFGGFGVGIESPRAVVRLRPRADGEVVATGSEARRATAFAERAWSSLE